MRTSSSREGSALSQKIQPSEIPLAPLTYWSLQGAHRCSINVDAAGLNSQGRDTRALGVEPLRVLDSESIRRRARRRRGRRARFLVDQFLQFLARLEVRHLLRRHVHLVAGLRIAALPRLAFPEPEAAEPPQLDLLATVQRLDDAAEHRIDDEIGRASCRERV